LRCSVLHTLYDPHHRLADRLCKIVLVEYGLGTILTDVIDNPLACGTEEESHDEQLRIVNVIYVPADPKCLAADIE
jgi:hypothetical protein